MSTKSDITRNQFMLNGSLAKCGYDWWWHSFTGREENTGEEKAFFIEFFTCNPALAKEEPVFGQLPKNREKGIRPSYMMVKAGAWGEGAVQLHRFFAWNRISLQKGVPFAVSAEDCSLTETHTAGRVSISEEDAAGHPEWMCGSGSMQWDLKIRKKIPFNVGYGAGKLFRAAKLFEMYWHAEGIKTEYEGEVIFNEKTYRIDPQTCYGYADKNWGKDFTSPWVWLSSNHIVSRKTGEPLENCVFDIGGGRPKIGFVALNRKLLSCLYYGGKRFEFNFSKFWTFSKTKFACEETASEIIWHVDQSVPKYRMVSDIRCKKNEMLLVNYEAPNGKKLHNRLWNGGTGVGTVKLYRRLGKKEDLIDELDARNIGCEYGEYSEH